MTLLTREKDPVPDSISSLEIVSPVYEGDFTRFSSKMVKVLSPESLGTRSHLARIIDHTCLRPTATSEDIDRLCAEARRYNFWSVCVSPYYIDQASRRLSRSSTLVCAVVGFPLGSTKSVVKLMEARGAIEDGAREIDMVSNIGALKSGDSQTYFADVNEVASYCRRSGVLLKVILECCYLTDEEKVSGARLSEQAGADFVKTSTGFGTGGATTADVALLRKTLSKRTGVKASGRISTYAKAMEMLKAGADRIGTSSGVAIIEEAPP